MIISFSIRIILITRSTKNYSCNSNNNNNNTTANNNNNNNNNKFLLTAKSVKAVIRLFVARVPLVATSFGLHLPEIGTPALPSGVLL